MQLEDESNSKRTPQSPSQVVPALTVSSVTHTYRRASASALKAISLSVNPGEIFGLLGPNGAGKTTAISVMSTLMRPTAGQISICGYDALRQPRQARHNIGVVPQHIAIFEALTARENLIYFGRLYGLKGCELRDAVSEGLTMAGLDERAHQAVKTFSTGMKRRLNLAAGILHHPKLLFLDEPTVGIDAQSRYKILENLIQLKEQGVTMVYTTHYMEEAQRLCSRLAIIDHGRIVAQNQPQALMHENPECSDLSELFLKLTGHRLRD